MVNPLLLTLALAHIFAAPAPAADDPLRAPVERIADATLADAARVIADVETGRPVVLYNPRILAALGPQLATFVLEHEDAHVRLGHLRAVGARPDASTLRDLELAADCSAARMLSNGQPAAVRAAVAHFDALGAARIDDEHPSGTERARRIRSCLE